MHYYQLKTPEDILNTFQDFEARFAEKSLTTAQRATMKGMIQQIRKPIRFL
jgi:hypothetical protein